MPYETVIKISNEYLFKFPPIYAMISSYLGIDNVKKFNSLKNKKNNNSTDVKKMSSLMGTNGRDINSLPPKKKALFEKLNELLKNNNK